MTKEEAGKLNLGDEVFIYDHGINLVYSALVVGIACPDLGKPKKPPVITIDITACSDKMGTRVYKSYEVHNSEIDALKKKSEKLDIESHRLLNEKSKVDQEIVALTKK